MTKNIQKILGKYLVLKRIPYICENISCGLAGQADVLSVNKSGYVSEYEVKISRGDFLKDKDKGKQDCYLNNNYEALPNYFYYVCPENLIKGIDIPDYAGLIYIINDEVNIIKKAKLIHKIKHNKNRIMERMVAIYTERTFLGMCLLTYNNYKLKGKIK